MHTQCYRFIVGLFSSQIGLSLIDELLKSLTEKSKSIIKVFVFSVFCNCGGLGWNIKKNID